MFLKDSKSDGTSSKHLTEKENASKESHKSEEEISAKPQSNIVTSLANKAMPISVPKVVMVNKSVISSL